MIPPEAWARTLHMIFNMIAVRRGVHWKLAQLPAEANPLGTGPLDEGETLGEAIANVMKYVPLPAKELGLLNDLGTLAFVMYATVNSRVQMDRYIAQQAAVQARGARVAHAAPEHAAVRAHHEPSMTLPADSANGVEPTAGDIMEQLTREHEAPLAAVTHEQPLTGHPVTDGVQLGRAATDERWETGRTEDPEPVLLEAFRPGEVAVPIDVLAASSDGNVLDRLAPPIEVEGQPAARELGDTTGG